MLRVLHIFARMGHGGAETTMMHVYRALDREKIQFDFLTTHDDKGAYDNEIESLGGAIYRLEPISRLGVVRFLRQIDKFFIMHPEYTIVHCQMNEWCGLFLSVAKRRGIPVRIAHARSTDLVNDGLRSIINMPFRLFMKSRINSVTTHRLACADGAGRWLYGKQSIARKEVSIVPNARPLNTFSFQKTIRSETREVLGALENTIIFGHVGSFQRLKNHIFLLKTFKYITEKNNNVLLVMAGAGELLNEMKRNACMLGIADQTRFLGLRDDVPHLMAAFDLLLLPSVFEGLPGVVIEAQASALPCLVSDTITKECDAGMELVRFISLSDEPVVWAETALMMTVNPVDREKSVDALYERGYDAAGTAHWYENFYTCLTL